MTPRAAVSWSGGKDSYLALHRSRSSYDVVALITMFDEDGTRSRSHGLRPQILEAQAQRLGLPICKTIVEAHGGRLWAGPNADGPGMRFSFSLPCHASSA